MVSPYEQLNQYLEQMLECVKPVNRERYDRINRRYSELLEETFLFISPYFDRYDHLRNSTTTILILADKKEEWASKIRKKHLSRVKKFLAKTK